MLSGLMQVGELREGRSPSDCPWLNGHPARRDAAARSDSRCRQRDRRSTRPLCPSRSLGGRDELLKSLGKLVSRSADIPSLVAGCSPRIPHSSL